MNLSDLQVLGLAGLSSKLRAQLVDLGIAVHENPDGPQWDLVLGPASAIRQTRQITKWREELGTVVWAEVDSTEDSVHVLNTGDVDRFISEGLTELQSDLLQVQAAAWGRRHQRRLKQDLQRQNTELSAMAERLEELVAERTGDMQRSKSELEAQTQRVQRLVRFVSDLSRWHHVDELMIYLRAEFRMFHELGEITLYWRKPTGEAELVFWQGHQLIHRETGPPPHLPLSIRMNDRVDQVYLATYLKRPAGRTITVPLSVDSPPAILFLEHGLKETERFLQHLQERLQALQLTWERIYGEQEAFESSRQWEEVFDTMVDPVAVLNREFRVVRANRSFSQFPGVQCHQQWADRDSHCLGCPLESPPGSAQLIQSRGRLWSVYSNRAEQDGASGTIVNHYVDVTESKRLFEQSIQSEKMASLGLLAGHIAHELNNPLTGIRSLAQVLMMENLPTTTSSDLKEVASAAERCERIIQNFLQFSQGESEPETVDLSELVQRTLPLLKTAFREHRTEFHWSNEPLMVRVQPHLLQQVVFNLVSNACQAMPDRGLLSLETRREDDVAVLAVRDTGIGMAKDVLSRIFEPFFTTKKEGEGTGLGLSLSQRIMRRFGGDIKVSSQIGEGSVFEVQLPIHAEKS